MKRTIISFICAAALLASGCSADATENNSSSQPTSSVSNTAGTTTVSSVTESTAASSAVTEPVTSTGSDAAVQPADKDDASLSQLRQSMTDKEMMAVIYFGFVDHTNDTATAELLTERAPSVCDEYSFVGDIPAERTVGGEFGDLFCIIPRDEGASVAVNRITIDENGDFAYDEVVYRSESGEPLLLYCNSGGFESDTQVNITDTEGDTFRWDAMTDDNNGVLMVRDEADNDLIRDLTSYKELLYSEYSGMRDEGWIVPTKEQLVDTSWGADEYLMDGRIVKYMLDIHEDTVSVQWNDGIDSEDHRYPDAQWEYSCEDGIALIKIDFREFAGELSYAVLLNDEGTSMYTCIDPTGDSVDPRHEKTDRYLVRSYG